ncbi:3-dehydro-L-gulonate 2-dehydrogenase [Clostridium sp.]|uniref:3-dehydro-L-gulonate 2-dehydrogenase n=1 Tax=Clostridium sp. TaxID=1506 RepID=UPI001A4BB6A2|nr:3-dehydro-L-gulonate 2-dehydrogenase [Clostridium sp.]MBK5240360.1 3-dehydro-L-gulonate 2-dehydrogenase [Clostridium sp.]
MRIPFEQMYAEIKRVMIKAGLTEEQAQICAKVHTESSRDGVYSHGLNRVSKFIDYVNKGWVDIKATPTLVKSCGCMENYDGNMGIGILNAKFAMNRAIELAKENNIGIVTLRNTTHWMRGGTYAWDAANDGFLSICWTNTESCMPAWGSKVPCVGNNPLCIGIPRKAGNIVLDMAMAQYSYGKLQITSLKGEQLPYVGGFDSAGNLTTDPDSIEESMRVLPIGYWKGSGLAILLDMVGAILSNGMPTSELDNVGKGGCGGCSQIFITINPHTFVTEEEINNILESTINHLSTAEPIEDDGKVYYPGQRTVKTREDSLENGIVADETVWNEICNL